MVKTQTSYLFPPIKNIQMQLYFINDYCYYCKLIYLKNRELTDSPGWTLEVMNTNSLCLISLASPIDVIVIKETGFFSIV